MRLLALDIETTGIDPQEHRLVEVYGSLWNADTRELLAEFEQRIDPERSIQAEASRVHGILYEDVAHCPRWNEVGPKFHRFMSKADVIVGHNGQGFDVPFLNAEFARIGLSSFSVPVIDTMLNGRFATPQGKLPNLGELAWACDVEYDAAKAHAARYDVSVMTECFFKGLDWGWFAIPQREFSAAAA